MAGIFDGSYLGVPVTGIFDTDIFDTFDGVFAPVGCPSLTSTLLSSVSLASTYDLPTLSTSRICDT